jgi:hypothetical protein
MSLARMPISNRFEYVLAEDLRLAGLLMVTAIISCNVIAGDNRTQGLSPAV